MNLAQQYQCQNLKKWFWHILIWKQGKMKGTMERAKLESKLYDMQRLIDRIPPEIRKELEQAQRSHHRGIDLWQSHPVLFPALFS